MSKELAVQLHILQKQLAVPKTRINKFAGYNYRNCEDILEAVKELLPAGCFVCVSDDIWQVGDRYYVRATAIFSDGEAEIKSFAYAREPLEKKGSDSMQITGAASSYARKYALNGLFSIDDSPDVDSQDNREEPKKAQQAKPQAYPQSPQESPMGRPQAKPQQVAPATLPEGLKDSVAIINMQYVEDDKLSASELWSHLSAENKTLVWGALSKEVQPWLKALLKNAPKAQKFNQADYAGV